MSFDSIAIIYNPNSTGEGGKNAKQLKSDLVLSFPKLPIELYKTKYAGHAKELAFEISSASKRPLIVSSSGDGGYNEVVNGAIEAQQNGAKPICAVLASGNANDHSRTLQNDTLVNAIKSQNIQQIDLLKIQVTNGSITEEQYAHSYIGFGLTPVAAAELNKTDLNAFKELMILVRTFYKYRPFKIKRRGKSLKLDSIIFANIGEMAKVLTISKESKPNDGLFEVVAFKHSSKLSLLTKLFKATVTGLDSPRKAQTYEFIVLRNMPVQLDGEVMKVKSKSSVRIISERKILSTIM